MRSLSPGRPAGRRGPASTSRLRAMAVVVMRACTDLGRHPRATVAVVAAVAASLVLLGASALASTQVRLLEVWYREHLPLQDPGPETELARQLLPLLTVGRNALAAAAVGAVLAVAVAVGVSTRVTALTRREDVRALAVTGASRADIRLWLLAQAAANGLAGALVAFSVLRLGTTMLMRAPREQAVFAGLRVISTGDLWAVLPLLIIAGVVACGAGGLLAQRGLARA